MISAEARICLCELPVFRGKSMDIAMFGKPLSHPFLTFHNHTTGTIRELHSQWFTPKTKDRQRLSRCIELTSTFLEARCGTYGKKAKKAFNLAIFDSIRPENRMTEIAEFGYERAIVETTLLQGPLSDIGKVWDSLKVIASDIDRMRRAYDRYEDNCQVLLKEAIERSGEFETKMPPLILAECGWF